MQVYRGLDIGTAKVTTEEMEGIPHHLINIKEPDEPFSVAEFQQRCTSLISEVNERGKLPFLVGGTGLYVNAVIQGYSFSEQQLTPIIAKSLNSMLISMEMMRFMRSSSLLIREHGRSFIEQSPAGHSRT